jgi:inorganic pyrophosphatase
VLVANQRGIVPGAVIAVRPVGVFLMQDEAGIDEKLIAVPASRLTRRYDQVNEYTQLPSITVEQIEHFFKHYKDLEPRKWVKVLGWGDASEARRIVLESMERAKTGGVTPSSPVNVTAPR